MLDSGAQWRLTSTVNFIAPLISFKGETQLLPFLLTLSLPKSGPVQTSYEEKLQLYSLYKQGE